MDDSVPDTAGGEVGLNDRPSLCPAPPASPMPADPTPAGPLQDGAAPAGPVGADRAASATDEDGSHAPATVAKALPEAEALPEALRIKSDEYRQALRAELQPRTALELVLVDEMARHAGAMEFSAAAEGHVLRYGARNNGLLRPDAPHDQELAHEAMFAAAISTNAADRAEKFGQQHRRAFYRALGQLQLLRGQDGPIADVEPAAVFDGERACETYLLGRMQAQPRRCPRCAKTKHHYLKHRRRWECAACGAQYGLRAGTVMARSPLPLAVWFAAILAVCADPQIMVDDLAERIGVRRRATVRSMLRAIRGATESGESEELLAGLHRLDGAAKPASGARFRKKTGGEKVSRREAPRKLNVGTIRSWG
ncbi:MAG TPA: IS1595 family transposase [Pirellulales bacterium]|nr:IS1595 family transposase [Pirellulales bacterium]